MAVQTLAPPITRRRFTVDEYYKMGEAGILKADSRVELLDGDVIEMSPIGIRHQHAVDVLTLRLVQGAGERAGVRIQGPLRLDERTEVQPDGLLLRELGYPDAHPTPADVLLLIEVADTTLAYDRDVKLPLYAACGIPEAWLVNLVNDVVVRNTEPTPDGYRVSVTYRRGDTIATTVLGSIEIAIPVRELLS
jgi:Uma2 family endonuclease